MPSPTKDTPTGLPTAAPTPEEDKGTSHDRQDTATYNSGDHPSSSQHHQQYPAQQGNASSHRTLPAVEVVDRQRQDDPLHESTSRDASPKDRSQVAIGTPCVGRKTPRSQIPSPTHRVPMVSPVPPPPPPDHQRSHSPSGMESENTFSSVLRAGDNKLMSSQDAYLAVQPTKQHSVIMTEGKRYRPVTEDATANQSFYPFAGSFAPAPASSFSVRAPEAAHAGSPPLEAFGRVDSCFSDQQQPQGSFSASVPPPNASFGTVNTLATPHAKPGKHESVLKSYLRGDTGKDQPIDANDPINNYSYFVGGPDADEMMSSSTKSSSSTSDESEPPNVCRNVPHAPFGTPSQLSMATQSNANKACGLPAGAASQGAASSSTFGAAGPASSLVSGGGGGGGGGTSGSDGRSSMRLTSHALNHDEAERFVETLKRSFALQRQRHGGPSNAPLPQPSTAAGQRSDAADNKLADSGILPTDNLRHSNTDGGSVGAGGGGAGSNNGLSNASFLTHVRKIEENYMLQPMHHALSCVSRENLEDDGVSLKAVWESLKSEALSRNILFGFRVTAFAVFPTFLLIEHVKTRGWFKAGALVPLMAGLFFRPSIGNAMYMAVLALQCVAYFIVLGVIMNAVGAVNHPSGWWCGVIFSVFVASLLGDVPSKRLMMVYGIIIMQTEHYPGGEALDFPCRFGLDFVVAIGFAVLASILPWPTFTYRQANEGILGLHKLYSAGIGNAMKSFWAPVNMDAKMALSQIPFVKISAMTANVRMAIHFTTYEPSEFNLNNTLRGQRLAMLQRIKMHLYAMSAASAHRLALTSSVHRSQAWHEIKEFEQRMQKPAMELAGEVMKTLVQVGAYIAADDVAANVSFDMVGEKSVMFSDIMERERMEMLFLRKLRGEETNACLRCFAFHFSLLDIASELQRFEQAMKNFDPSKYPSIWRRALNFFVLEAWKNFWDELPHRVLLDRPVDVRLLKDGIRYAGAIAAACAFTLNYDKNNVYYFGMAILVRLAQQTASETLAVGVNRICGLCIGASLAYITHNKTHNTAEMTLLTMTWAFIAMCFSQHPTYGAGAQYVLVTSIAGLRLAPQPALLLTRITDNVFAFISYYIICTFVFPVDPIRVLWNTRTKCFVSMNDLAQTIVTLGCAPITMDGKTADFMLEKARATVTAQQGLLKSYAEWMVKASTEPTLRGGDYPAAASARLRLLLNEVMSLEEALLAGVARLHRPRDQPASVVLRDMMELTRPFLIDAGRLIHRIFQSMIDATEKHRTWSMEDTLRTIWKSQLACRSLRHVTGNMQRNFYAAVQQVAPPDKEILNVYLNSSVVEDALMKDLDPSLLRNKDNEELVQRVLAVSFHMNKDAVMNRDDLQAFNAIIIVFELLLRTLSELLPPMIEIYEFEKSRHVNVFK